MLIAFHQDSGFFIILKSYKDNPIAAFGEMQKGVWHLFLAHLTQYPVKCNVAEKISFHGGLHSILIHVQDFIL